MIHISRPRQSLCLSSSQQYPFHATRLEYPSFSPAKLFSKYSWGSSLVWFRRLRGAARYELGRNELSRRCKDAVPRQARGVLSVFRHYARFQASKVWSLIYYLLNALRIPYHRIEYQIWWSHKLDLWVWTWVYKWVTSFQLYCRLNVERQSFFHS